MAVATKTSAVVVEGKPITAVVERTNSFEDVPKDKWRWVTVPDIDMYDHPFGPVQINEHTFASGKHFVPPDFADEIERIIARHQDYLLHLMQPRKRKEVLASVNKNANAVVS